MRTILRQRQEEWTEGRPGRPRPLQFWKCNRLCNARTWATPVLPLSLRSNALFSRLSLSVVCYYNNNNNNFFFHNIRVPFCLYVRVKNFFFTQPYSHLRHIMCTVYTCIYVFIQMSCSPLCKQYQSQTKWNGRSLRAIFTHINCRYPHIIVRIVWKSCETAYDGVVAYWGPSIMPMYCIPFRRRLYYVINYTRTYDFPATITHYDRVHFLMNIICVD